MTFVDMLARPSDRPSWPVHAQVPIGDPDEDDEGLGDDDDDDDNDDDDDDEEEEPWQARPVGASAG